MPGRPKTMAKKVGELEEAAVRLAWALGNQVPRRALVDVATTDAVLRAWRKAVNGTLVGSIGLQILGSAVREKAGIVGPGPSMTFFDRNPPPDSKGEDMIKNVEKLEDAAGAIAIGVFITAPELHRKATPTTGPPDTPWRKAIDGTMLAAIFMDRLLTLLREQAGVAASGEGGGLLPRWIREDAE